VPFDHHVALHVAVSEAVRYHDPVTVMCDDCAKPASCMTNNHVGPQHLGHSAVSNVRHRLIAAVVIRGLAVASSFDVASATGGHTTLFAFGLTLNSPGASRRCATLVVVAG
jgi:hypothetical protein